MNYKSYDEIYEIAASCFNAGMTQQETIQEIESDGTRISEYAGFDEELNCMFAV